MLAGAACPGARICDLAGSGSGDDGGIWRSTDGGGTWDAQLTAITGGFFLAIACPSVAACEAAGYGGTGLALRTADGGKTWARQRLPRSVQVLQAVSCPSVTVCVAVGINVTQAGSKESGTAVTTADGGTAWTRQRNPPGFTGLTGVACPSAGGCEAAGLGRTHAVAVTTDGGTAWAGQGVPGSVFLQGIACPAAGACETAGENAGE